MYDQYYGFTGRPFQLTPDPNFYFESGTHRKAMSYLGYGLAQGEGFIVITGDIGAGKTTLVGHLMNTIDPGRLTAVKLVSTQVEGDDLLRLVAEQFALDWDGLSKAELLRAIEQFLREQARAGRRTLLIVDEGQNLAISALEELRMLSNFQLGGHSLLQIFLLGQPEFRQTLFHTPTLEQLRQRVIATHHLDPMEPEEVEPYILHRLGKVGWAGNPSFSPDAFETIFDYSEGVPRKLNVLVTRLLLFGAVEQLSRITGQHVRAVVAEVEADRGMNNAPPPAAPLSVEMPEPEPEDEPAPAPFIAPFAAPADEEEPPMEWPVRDAKPAAVGIEVEVVVDAESAEPAAPPFAAPTADRAARDMERLARQNIPDDVEMLPPSHAATRFVEARSLVAAQLEPQNAPVPDAPVAEDAAPHGFPPEAAPFAPSFDVPDQDAEPAYDEAVRAPVALPAAPAFAPPVDDAHLVALQRQIAGLEARIADQDAALRRVLDLLIDWVERDPAGSPGGEADREWAA